LEIGIMGLASAGKTTVFNALARQQAAIGTYGAAAEPNRAVVHVPDDRLARLRDMFSPRKYTPAEVRYLDVAGLVQGMSENGSGTAAQLIGNLRNADALLQVTRAFANDTVAHPAGSIDPVRDVETVGIELALADLGVIEKRLERLEKDLRSAKLPPNSPLPRERELLVGFREGLEHGRPIRDHELSDSDQKLLRGYGFLTAKPMLIVLNVGDEDVKSPDVAAQVAAVQAAQPFANTDVTALAGRLEMELSELSPDEAAEFMSDLGIDELGLNRVIQLSYRLLDLVSFFTAGPDEVRAWTIQRDCVAPEAARAIHSDISRGFIRAEVVHYNDLVAAGGLVEARKRGVLRSEGKSYSVADGDVIEFLFNV
jgi:ribosome-binding ATPase